jgi:Cof subfamily protein (haloacid dehalogenase superfamily)
MDLKGWLALDIDGTITDRQDKIPKKVISFLRSLNISGWKTMILTGRSFPFAMEVLKEIDFPYILSTQNGSSAWHMPQKKLIYENFLSLKALLQIEKELLGIDVALIPYGLDHKSYAKKNKNHEKYIKKILATQKGEILSNFDYDNLKNGPFLKVPLVKCAGLLDEILKAKEKLKKLSIEVAHIKDPFFTDYHLLLITKKKITKGFCISKILKIYEKGFVIAAGNDGNDHSMFDFSDIKIAMEDSPADLLSRADIVAPTSKKMGIIEALKKAIHLCNSN